MWLPEPAGEDPAEGAYTEASVRRLAARHTGEALEHFERLPGIEEAAVEVVKETFARWEQEATASLEELDRRVGQGGRELRRRQAEAVSRVAATDALREVAEVGLCSGRARHAAWKVGGLGDSPPGEYSTPTRLRDHAKQLEPGLATAQGTPGRITPKF